MPQIQHPQDHPGAEDGGRQYGKFQNEIYYNGLLKNAMPTVTTDPNKLEAQAKEHLGVTSFNYVAGGAGEKATMVSCLEDLQSCRIPQTLLLEKGFGYC